MIKLYTLPECNSCDKLKDYLKNHNIEFTEISYDDLKTNRELRHEYQSLDQQTFPTLFDTEKHIVMYGYNKRKLDNIYK